jgi:hypothetical protein
MAERREKREMRRILMGVGLCALFLSVSVAHAGIVGYLSTDGQLLGNGAWASAAGGYRVTWSIDRNGDGSWHYAYSFSFEDGSSLKKLTSHFIISLSDNISSEDIYNLTGDWQEVCFGVFGPAPSNPGFPEDETISGMKIDLSGAQTAVAFDSNRQPTWGDFYAKDGKTKGLWNYSYNVDIGVDVANPHDYTGTAVDAEGGELAKMLVPDTVIPEPCAFFLMVFGGVIIRRRGVGTFKNR